MAGQRYATTTLNSITPMDNDFLHLWLGGTYRTFTASTAYGTVPPIGTYLVSDYATAGARAYNGEQLAEAIRAMLDFVGYTAAYTVTTSHNEEYDIHQIKITATDYDPFWNFEPAISNVMGINFYEQERLDAIRPIAVVATPTIARCFGSSTGTITLSVTGGNTSDYAYAWADGPTTRDRTGLAAGSYAVTVTEATGVTETVTAVVGQNTLLTVAVSQTDGDVELAVTGGVSPYTFDWEDGAEGASRLGLPAGDYPCLIVDALGCSASVTVHVESSRFYFAGNPITLALDAGDAYRADPTTKPNLSFGCEVWVEEEYLSETFTQLGTLLEQPADRTGRTVFEVQELLSPYLDYHVPGPDDVGIVRAAPLFRRFYLRSFEQFGTPAVPAPRRTQTQHYVVLGGLDFYESRAGTWFTSYQAGAMPFFTWEPNDKAVAVDQPEFLYCQAAGSLLFCHVLVRYEDGTSDPVATYRPLQTRRYELYCWAVGFAALGLVDAPTRRVAGWEVWLSGDGTTPQTEIRRFVLDRRPVATRRYFLFATSLGGMATFVAQGEAQLDAEVTGEEAERALPPGDDPQRGDVVVQDRSLRPVLKMASGFRTRAQMAAAQDLLLSRRVLLLNGPRWLPGYFKAKTVLVREDGKSLPTLELDFYLPRQRFYTPRLPQTPAGQPVLPISHADQFLP